MACKPGDNNLNPPNLGPPPNIPPDGPAFSVPKIPFPDVSIPLEGIPEDLIELVERLFAALPGGLLRPNLNENDKSPLDAIANLLNQIAPYLALYSFFQALLEIILCIIDVLCALIKPRRVIKAVKRLFKRCLPNFLALFPWLALLAMIIALILLLLALIEYIINTLIAYIRDIIQNILDLAEAVQFNDSESIVVITRKIAYLLCLLEQLFAILIAVQAIFAIIEALLSLAGRGFCLRQSRGESDFACCPEEDCPTFIGDYPDGIPSVTGNLRYYARRYAEFTAGLTTQQVTLRPESWQFYDTNSSQDPSFKDVITPLGEDEDIYWPEDLILTGESPKKAAPYTVDLTVDLDPADWGNPSDTGGYRTFTIQDAIVSIKPYIGVYDEDNSINKTINSTGTFKLVGGKVYEEDGSVYFIGNDQATIETLITTDDLNGPASVDDGYNFLNISYTWKPNHPTLFDYRLITLFCIPELQVESAVLNASYDITAAIDKIGALPNIGTIDPPSGALGCLSQELAALRQNVSIENAESFQANAIACLQTLRGEAIDTYGNAIDAATDRYKSTVVLDPDLQFVGNPITVSVQLKDSSGVLLTNSIPEESREAIAENITGTVSLGELGAFEYDGYDTFTAQINSDFSGDGSLRIYYNEVIFAEFLNRDDDDVETSIEERIFSYTFVGAPVSTAPFDPKARRDESDVANS